MAGAHCALLYCAIEPFEWLQGCGHIYFPTVGISFPEFDRFLFTERHHATDLCDRASINAFGVNMSLMINQTISYQSIRYGLHARQWP
jgi:hypothetical protein